MAAFAAIPAQDLVIVASLRRSLRADVPEAEQLAVRKTFKHATTFPLKPHTECVRLCDTHAAFVSSDLELWRFLQGCDRNLAEAREYVLKHLAWREEYKIDGILDEDWSAIEAEGWLYGRGENREGCPCVVFRVNRHNPKKHSVETCVRYFVYVLEKTLQRRMPQSPSKNPLRKIVALFDCYGVKMRHVSVAPSCATGLNTTTTHPARATF